MIRKRTLDNGLTLLTESMPDVRSVTIGVWLRQGSRSDHTTRGPGAKMRRSGSTDASSEQLGP